MDTKNLILEMYNAKSFRSLSAFYNKQTVFNILKIERNENRHSAFLCWLLNPNGGHALGDAPLKKFLGLYASIAPVSPLTNAFITGNYDLDVIECTTEKMTEKGRRMDVWMIIRVNVDNEEYIVPAVIENKIYAKQSRNQTEDYHKEINALKHSTSEKCVPVEVFLAPDGKEKATCTSFINISYQQLLDWVLEPVYLMNPASETGELLEAFIRNLSKPAALSLDDDSNKTLKSEEDSILAVSKREANSLYELYDGYSDLLNHAIVAVVGDKAKDLFCNYDDIRTAIETEGSMELLQDFWETNSDIFRSILFVCKTKISPALPEKVLECFKTSKRDNSKYVVEKPDEQGNWVPAIPQLSKPMSKGRAACTFFSAWVQKNHDKTLDYVLNTFPLTLNTYYGHRKDGKFDCIIYTSSDNKIAKSTTPESLFSIQLKDATWEFYTDGCGKANLDSIDEALYFVKMWRKADFENLLKHIEQNPNLFGDLRIRRVK
jgi:hypothetical protein